MPGYANPNEHPKMQLQETVIFKLNGLYFHCVVVSASKRAVILRVFEYRTMALAIISAIRASELILLNRYIDIALKGDLMIDVPGRSIDRLVIEIFVKL